MVTIGLLAPVVETTRSALINSGSSISHGWASPAVRLARSSARSILLFTICISVAFKSIRYWSVSSPISPAPMTKMVLSSKRSKNWLAKSATATLGMLIRRLCKAVSVAIRFATRSAAWNDACVRGPVKSPSLAISYACLTWDRIWASPTTMLSRLAAVVNKWRMASSPESWRSSEAISVAFRPW